MDFIGITSFMAFIKQHLSLDLTYSNALTRSTNSIQKQNYLCNRRYHYIPICLFRIPDILRYFR